VSSFLFDFPLFSLKVLPRINNSSLVLKISVSQLRDNSRNQSTLSAQFLDSPLILSLFSLSLS
jgi:hypothetical protein